MTKASASKSSADVAPMAIAHHDLGPIGDAMSVVLMSAAEPELLLKRDALVAAGGRMVLNVEAADAPTLTDFATRCTRFGKGVSETRKEIERERKKLKQPLTDAGKEIDRRFKELDSPLEAIEREAKAYILACQHQLARLEAAAVLGGVKDGQPIEGVVVAAPPPIRTDVGVASTRKQSILIVDDIRLLAVARPDLVSPREADILAELRNGVVIPGVHMGETETVAFR